MERNKINNESFDDSKEFTSKDEYELIPLVKTKKTCFVCEKYSVSQLNKKDLVAIVSCEGACLRGEISRRAANEICYKINPEQTARVCMGGAFTKDTGQRNMVRNAKRVIILEGCIIECASRMINAVVPALNAEVIILDKYYEFDRSLFGINEVSSEELEKYTTEAISNIKDQIRLK